MITTTLLVMTDGRAECLAASMATLDRLHGPIAARVIHDDSGSPGYTRHLAENYPGWTIVSTGRRAGFAGAYRNAWAWLRAHCTTDFVFSTEDDFRMVADVNLPELASVLRFRPHLAQMALLRQPWNRTEKAAGGIIAADRPSFTERTDGTHHWVEHRKFWTTNPHLARMDTIRERGWPDGEQSEGRFSVALFRSDPCAVSAFWGRADDPPRVEHIGAQRVGTGY